MLNFVVFLNIDVPPVFHFVNHEFSKMPTQAGNHGYSLEKMVRYVLTKNNEIFFEYKWKLV